MTQPKRGLGRGLDALFGGSPAAEPEARIEPAARVPEPVATVQLPATLSRLISIRKSKSNRLARSASRSCTSRGYP